MIPLEQFQRYLSDVEGTDPFSVLGLTPETCSTVRIEDSLRRRIALTYARNGGSSDEAEQVRSALRAAADELRHPERRRYHAESRRSNPAHMLTPFDRAVLAILVASSGWNVLSRARLVGLAASRGITVQGLMKVIAGLSQYAKTGGPRLAMAQIASGQPRFPTGGVGHGPFAQMTQVGQALFERFTPEWREQSTRTTVMLSMFFGILAVLVCVLAIGYFVLPLTESPSPSQALTDAPPARGAAPTTVPGEGMEPEERHNSRRDVVPAPLMFEQWPTFRVELPDEIVEARQRAADLPVELETLSRRLLLDIDASDAIFHKWEAIVDDAAASWMLLDPELLRRIEDGIIDVLYVASDSLRTRDRLLRMIVPNDVRSLEPIDVCRGAWKIGMLTRISHSDLLSPAMIDDARAQLRVAMQHVNVERSAQFEPRDAQAHWLDAARKYRIERHSGDGFTFWECWLAAREHTATQEALYTAVGEAIKNLLHQPRDFFEYEPPVRILGRLIEALDFETSPATKEVILPFVTDEQFSADALYVLSSLLARAPGAAWFVDEFVVPPEADMVMRRRLADRIERAWPDLATIESELRVAGAGLHIDDIIAEAWRELFNRVVSIEDGRDEEANIRRLVAATRLNEAAVHLAEQNTHRSERALIAIESLLESERGADAGRRRSTTNPRGRTGPAESEQPATRTGASDAEWARDYQRAGRDVNERLDLLHTLRERSRPDLSENAASVFVREVYRGVPREVRETAQSVLLDRFQSAPTVALEMLDQFVDVPRTRMTSDMISRFTGRTLRDARRDEWHIHARRALAEHVLALRFPQELPVDSFASDLNQAHYQQSAAIRRRSDAVSEQLRPTDSIVQLYESWRERAESLQPRSHVVPTDRHGLAQRHLTRLRLANHSMQQYIAHQIGVLELLAYVTSVEQPALVEHIDALLAENARRRTNAVHALEQAWLIERGISALWHLRFFPAEREERRSHMSDAGAADGRPRSNPVSATDTHPGNKWTARLESLRPNQPEAYFTLAEEVADAARSDAERQLARQLFSLAGLLDPDRLAASASLALRELETNEQRRSRLLALAAMLNPAMSIRVEFIEGRPGGGLARFDGAVVLELSYAFSAYRQGDGRRAINLLEGDAGDLLDDLPGAMPGGRSGLIERSRTITRGQRPNLSSDRLERMLGVEVSLLSSIDERSWSGELLLFGNAPLIEADPDRLDDLLNVDEDRPYYRDGRWVDRALPR